MMPRIKLEQEIHPGIFSCSNALARRELLRKYPFSEKLGHGGEDVEVAYRIIKSGFYIASVPNLLVMEKILTISIAAYNAELDIKRCLDSFISTNVLTKYDTIDMQSSLILQNSRELLQVAQQVRNLFIMD